PSPSPAAGRRANRKSRLAQRRGGTGPAAGDSRKGKADDRAGDAFRPRRGARKQNHSHRRRKGAPLMVFRALVLRPMLREKLRTLLTLFGIAVGVGVVVAIALSNQSALRAFRESVDAVSGRANYQIASDSGLDEDLLLKLQPFWRRGVRFAPVIDVDGILEPSQIPIRLLAVDL